MLELKLPNIKDVTSEKAIIKDLYKLLPYFTAYILSFVTIGIYWLNHHHMFHWLEKTDEPLLILDIFSLFWVSLIPLTTALLGNYPTMSISSGMYGFVMFMTTLSFGMMRAYAIKKDLIHKANDRKHISEIKSIFFKANQKSVAALILYGMSIPLAYYNVYFSYVCFIFPPIIFLIPQGTKNQKLVEEIGVKNN